MMIKTERKEIGEKLAVRLPMGIPRTGIVV
jgi:hypothetical protein